MEELINQQQQTTKSKTPSFNWISECLPACSWFSLVLLLFTFRFINLFFLLSFTLTSFFSTLFQSISHSFRTKLMPGQQLYNNYLLLRLRLTLCALLTIASSSSLSGSAGSTVTVGTFLGLSRDRNSRTSGLGRRRKRRRVRKMREA